MKTGNKPKLPHLPLSQISSRRYNSARKNKFDNQENNNRLKQKASTPTPLQSLRALNMGGSQPTLSELPEIDKNLNPHLSMGNINPFTQKYMSTPQLIEQTTDLFLAKMEQELQVIEK